MSHRLSAHGSAYSLSGLPATSPVAGDPPSVPSLPANESNSNFARTSTPKLTGSVPDLSQQPLVEVGLARPRQASNQQLAAAPLVDKRLDRVRRSEGALQAVGGRQRSQSESSGG